MAYAMGRTPAKPHQRPEVNAEVDLETDPLIVLDGQMKPAIADELTKDLGLGAMEAPLLVNMEEPVDVRRLTGEWEKGLQPVKPKTTPPPSKTNARIKQTTIAVKARTKEIQLLPLEPKTSLTRRQATEATISPEKTIGKKYISRLTEAKAMMSKVRHYLNSSRNTSGVIKKEVMDAAERLTQLVGEAEAERRNDQKNGVLSYAVKDGEEQDNKRDSNIPVILRRDDRILEKLEENNRLLKENDKRMQEIGQEIKDQRESMEKVTYASIVTEGKKNEITKRTNERKILHSIVVTSQDEQETGEEVLDKIRKAVEAKEGWIRVDKVRKAKDRKIIMGCSTREDREKIRQKIEKAGQRLVVEDMKNKDPLLLLKDVLIMHSDEEVIRALRNQNRELFHGLDNEENRIAIKYRKKTRNPHTGHIVVTASPTIWGRATEQGRLRIDLQNVFVEDQSPLVQCSKCLGYGHGRRFCKAPADLCSHCGGPHLSADCPDKEQGEAPTCTNCKRAGSENASHNAFSRECPVRRKWDSIARASTQYC